VFRSWSVMARARPTASASRRRDVDRSTDQSARGHACPVRAAHDCRRHPGDPDEPHRVGRAGALARPRLGFSDRGPGDVIAVDLDARSEVMLHLGSFACCPDWLPDGRMLVVSSEPACSSARIPMGRWSRMPVLRPSRFRLRETSWSSSPRQRLCRRRRQQPGRRRAVRLGDHRARDSDRLGPPSRGRPRVSERHADDGGR